MQELSQLSYSPARTRLVARVAGYVKGFVIAPFLFRDRAPVPVPC